MDKKGTSYQFLGTIGKNWMAMTDIKGLSSAFVQHHIHLNEEGTPKRDPQRRLNPMIQEVVRAKF